jgi:hypothetical protein
MTATTENSAMPHAPIPDSLHPSSNGKTIAAQAVAADIETGCVRVDLGDGHRWYDTRPMLDPREHAPDVVEMSHQALQWAEAEGVVQRHPEQRHLARITAPAQGL